MWNNFLRGVFFFGECRWYYSFSNQPSSKLVSIHIFSWVLWLMKRNLYFNWQVRNTLLFLQLIYKELFLGILKWILIIESPFYASMAYRGIIVQLWSIFIPIIEILSMSSDAFLCVDRKTYLLCVIMLDMKLYQCYHKS